MLAVFILAQVVQLVSPAGANSAEPNLSVSADGRFVLSWTEELGDESHALRFATRRSGEPWSAAGEVARGRGWFVNWADFPSVIAHPDGSLWAHWLFKSGDSKYAYDAQLARSADAGKTWSKAVVPHRDGTPSEHGFVSLLPWGDGVGAVWLDGRNAGGRGGQTALMFASVGAGGQMGPEVVLDPRVCDCCQTAALRTKAGVLVVYRDRSDKETRDISSVRFAEKRWSPPRDVSADGWTIDGCPVNGPALDGAGKQVALAWFSAAKGPRVLVAVSSDGGIGFGTPIRVDEGKPQGRVAVSLLPSGAALVSWLEGSGDAARVLARRVAPDGVKGDAILVAATTAARASGFPRMARVGAEVVFAWTEPGGPSRVRTATLRP